MWPFKSKEQRSAENPAVSLADPNAFEKLFGIPASAAGETVTFKTALSVPAIWSGVNFLSGTIASLPLILYRQAGDEREKADNDPLQARLNSKANREWSSYKWRKYSMQMTLLSGRSFTWIQRNRAGGVANFWPLDPSVVTPEMVGGRTVYHWRPEDSENRTFDAQDIIDIPWMLEPDQITHIDPISRLRKTIGLSIALESYAARLFENGGVPPLQLTGPMNSPAAAERASKDILSALRKARSEGRNVLPMPTGHELKGVGFNPEQSQLEQARRFQVEEVARFLDLPPVFLQDLTHGTFSNTEQQDLHFVKHTLTQWLRAWEQELNIKLFPSTGSRRFVEFNVDGLLRGDFKTRMEGYAQAIQNSIKTPNEVRRKENDPPLEGGDDLMVQQNMTGLNRLGEGNGDGGTPPDGGGPGGEGDE